MTLGDFYQRISHLAGLFARLLCCENAYIARYAPILTPRRQANILRDSGHSFLSIALKQIQLTEIQALFQQLGAVEMVRFLQQFYTGWGNYTEERQAWLNQDEDIRTLTQKIIAQRTE